MKFIIAIVILIHGLIHFMGFAKAFNYAAMKQLTIPVSKPAGMMWMVTALLFIATAVLYLMKKEYWWMVAVPAVIISQIVIIMSWKDAKFGTVANILILIAVVLSWGSSRFENTYLRDVKENLQRSNALAAEILSDADIRHLPLPVQRYLVYAGVVNKPKVKNVTIVFEGQMRDKGKAYFPFSSEQYNFFDEPTRLFFMKGKMYGVTVPGYHRYSNGTATMDIRLFGLFPIVQKAGEEMNRAETVTLFNDMCLLAPATLIDKRIQWQTIDSSSVKAVFTNHNITISAVLYFNSQDQLIDFISTDRTAVADMKPYPFSTPVHAYKRINGFNLISEADAVWHYPEGKFTYGKFKLKDVKYNVAE
jgi:hypothetical protein